MSKLLFLAILLAVAFVDEAAADHLQLISQQSAEAFCKNHGGGTSCSFCHADHCHTVECSSIKGVGCYNLVTSARAGGGVKPPGTGATSASTGSAGNPQKKGTIPIGTIRAPISGSNPEGGTTTIFSAAHRGH